MPISCLRCAKLPAGSQKPGWDLRVGLTGRGEGVISAAPAWRGWGMLIEIVGKGRDARAAAGPVLRPAGAVGLRESASV